MVVLVSFQFHSISAFELWTFGLLKCTSLLGIPFWHVFEQMLIVCGVGFWAAREPRQGPRREWRGPGNCGSVPSGHFVVQQLDLYRVGHADLEGQRFVSCFFGSIKKVCFITQSTEPLTLSILLPNRKCRLFSAW